MTGDLIRPHNVPIKSPWFDVADVFKRTSVTPIVIDLPKGCSYNSYLLGFKGAAVGQNIKYTLTHTFGCRGKRRCATYI